MNRVLKHRKNEGMPVNHFANQQAYTGHNRDNNSHVKKISSDIEIRLGKVTITFADTFLTFFV